MCIVPSMLLELAEKLARTNAHAWYRTVRKFKMSPAKKSFFLVSFLLVREKLMRTSNPGAYTGEDEDTSHHYDLSRYVLLTLFYF